MIETDVTPTNLPGLGFSKESSRIREEICNLATRYILFTANIQGWWVIWLLLLLYSWTRKPVFTTVKWTCGCGDKNSPKCLFYDKVSITNLFLFTKAFPYIPLCRYSDFYYHWKFCRFLDGAGRDPASWNFHRIYYGGLQTNNEKLVL